MYHRRHCKSCPFDKNRDSDKRLIWYRQGFAINLPKAFIWFPTTVGCPLSRGVAFYAINRIIDVINHDERMAEDKERHKPLVFEHFFHTLCAIPLRHGYRKRGFFQRWYRSYWSIVRLRHLSIYTHVPRKQYDCIPSLQAVDKVPSNAWDFSLQRNSESSIYTDFSARFWYNRSIKNKVVLLIMMTQNADKKREQVQFLCMDDMVL